MIGIVLALVGFFVAVSMFGERFGAGAREIGAGISAMLSPQIRPAIIPVVGIETTPAIAQFGQAISDWIASLTIPQLPGPSATNGNGGTTAGGDKDAGTDEETKPIFPWYPMRW